MTLSASATSLAVGAEVTLLATANQEIESPYGVTIRDDVGDLVVSCFGLVDECESFPFAYGDENRTATFTARIVHNTGTPVLATSDPVTVTWGTGSTPPTTTDVSRVAGADRFATSAALSSAAFAPGVPVAYLATGMSFADALAGGAAAAAEGGPVLTTARDALPASVITELGRLRPAVVVILGGTAAVSDAAAAMAGLVTGAPVVRVAGVDRYATAAAVSTRVFDPGIDSVFVATGETFADALSAGVAAAAMGVPVLLVQGQALPAATAAELVRLSPATIYLVSTAGAVSDGVVTQLRGYADNLVQYTGADRYASSAAVSAATFGTGVATLYLATGEVFADALAGVALAGRTASPMLLVRPACVPTAVGNEITRLDPAALVLLGGTGAISSAVETLTAC